jgi:uncharacterized surface protein with fasciclin (FAS1) repeats
MKTANGEPPTFIENGPHNIADISTYDVIWSNGVIMVVDKVLMPR